MKINKKEKGKTKRIKDLKSLKFRDCLFIGGFYPGNSLNTSRSQINLHTKQLMSLFLG